MTPTEIQSVLDALSSIKSDVEDLTKAIDWVALVHCCDQARAAIEDLRKDRERLDWLVKDNSVITGNWIRVQTYLNYRADFREAIDEAMTQRGEG